MAKVWAVREQAMKVRYELERKEGPFVGNIWGFGLHL